MAKFIFITDTHIGALSSGYFEQQKYPERLTGILLMLEHWIQEAGDIDFIIHGGDMVEASSDELIQTAVDTMAQLSVPVYLCLGNHDFSDQSTTDKWLHKAPDFFVGNSSTYTIQVDEYLIHVLPTQYGDAPCLFPEQLEYLDTALDKYAKLPHIVVTHYPLFNVSPEQLGEKIQTPPTPASIALLKRVELFRNIPLLLCGHNHVNTNIRHCATQVVTCSSLIETPFEFKVIELKHEFVSMKTISLASSMSYIGDYNFNKTFVQGREIDRYFQNKLKDLNLQ